jgi:sortase A
VLRPAGPTRIVVASVGIDALVSTVGYTFTNGALEYDVPRREAGHYVDSALPGNRGNVVIGGHVANRSGAKAVFAPLPGVKAGDVIEVYRGDQVFRYSITEIKVVAVEATSVMSQTQDARLTLITCFPERNYPHRLVVVGKLV